MKIQQVPGPQILYKPKEQATQPTTPEPQPAPPRDFVESSRSLKRDGLMAAALASPLFVPSTASTIANGVVGTLGLVAGYGEMREGMRTMNTHEVVGGVLHMSASSAMLVSASVSNPVTATLAATVGLSLLAAKTVLDHPKDLVDVVVYQPITLVRDAGKSVWNEFHHKTDKPEPSKN